MSRQPRRIQEPRRADIIRVAYELISSGGTEAATIRKMAEAAGYSTMVVSHYFANKKAIMQATYDLSKDSSFLRQKAAGKSGKLQKVMEALVPIDPIQKKNWRIWFAFWNASLSDADFAKQQRDVVKSTRRWLKDFMRESSFIDENMPEDELGRLVRQILSVVVGIATQASFDQRDWPAKRQREVICDFISHMSHHS